MNIEVHITQVMQPKTGTSKNGNPYTIYQYVGETFEQYSRKVLFTQIVNAPLPPDPSQWGAANCPFPNIGDDLDIHFDLETRIFQKRDGSDGYDTQVKPYRTINLANQPDPAAVAQPQQAFNTQQQYMAPPPNMSVPTPNQQAVYPAYQQAPY